MIQQPNNSMNIPTSSAQLNAVTNCFPSVPDTTYFESGASGQNSFSGLSVDSCQPDSENILKTILPDPDRSDASSPPLEMRKVESSTTRLTLADDTHINRKSILDYRRSLKISDANDLRKLSYLTFVEYLSSEKKNVKVVFTSGDYEIRDEKNGLIENISNLSEICNKQLVSLKLSFDDIYESEYKYESAINDCLIFFETFANLNVDYFLYSIGIDLPEAEHYGRPDADDMKQIYELVLSSGRSYKGSLNSVFASKYHAYAFYESLNNWMNNEHEPGSLVDIFNHKFSQRVTSEFDWADPETAENVDDNFHKKFLCADPIPIYDNPHVRFELFDKIKAGSEFLRFVAIIEKEVTQVESRLNILMNFPHILEKIILSFDSPLSYKEKKQIRPDFLFKKTFSKGFGKKNDEF